MIRGEHPIREILMANLNIGDLVRLKSGGPLMTVRELTTARLSSAPDSPKDHVQCQWFDEKQISKIVRFPIAALELDSSSRLSSH
jgi:uncharacterized protein YodC (DUF2158 family)